MREDERDRVSRLGSEAWKRLKKCKDYNDWVKVGEAILVGREWAMNQSQTNKPEGKAYNMAFGEWLQRYKLDDMDKGDRSRLFHMMDALPQIENWRRTITLAERLKLNHPNAGVRSVRSVEASKARLARERRGVERGEHAAQGSHRRVRSSQNKGATTVNIGRSESGIHTQPA